jgi:hypothetical protein
MEEECTRVRDIVNNKRRRKYSIEGKGALRQRYFSTHSA